MIYCNKSYMTLVSFKISYRPALTLLVMTWDDKMPPWRDEGRWVTQACDDASGEDRLLPHGRERGGRWGTADRVCAFSDRCRHEDASREWAAPTYVSHSGAIFLKVAFLMCWRPQDRDISQKGGRSLVHIAAYSCPEAQHLILVPTFCSCLLSKEPSFYGLPN